MFCSFISTGIKKQKETKTLPHTFKNVGPQFQSSLLKAYFKFIFCGGLPLYSPRCLGTRSEPVSAFSVRVLGGLVRTVISGLMCYSLRIGVLALVFKCYLGDGRLEDD